MKTFELSLTILYLITQPLRIPEVLPSCCCTFAKSWLTLWDSMDCNMPVFPVLLSMSLLKLISSDPMMLSNQSHPLLPASPPALNFSQHPGSFYSESALCNRCPKYWSFSFNISSSNEYSGLISFRVDWFGLLAVQETLKSLLQHHNLKASILWHSTFFTVQLSHPYVTTGKTKALTLRTFVGKVMSLLFNTLSRFVISSVQFSHSVMSDSLRPHESQHARPPCPSPTPGVHQNPCPLSRWCHLTISSSVVPFPSCPQSFPASWSFQMSQFFTSGGQSIRVSASTSVLPMNIQVWSLLGWTGWISLQSNGLSRVFSNTTVQKHQFFSTQLFL